MNNWLPALAIASLICVPLTPQLLQLRLRFLRWINWTLAADLLEKHFRQWVLLMRALLLLVAGLLPYLGAQP